MKKNKLTVYELFLIETALSQMKSSTMYKKQNYINERLQSLIDKLPTLPEYTHK